MVRYNILKNQEYSDLIKKLESGKGNCKDYNKYIATRTIITPKAYTEKIAKKYNCINAYSDLALTLKSKNIKKVTLQNDYSLENLTDSEKKEYLYYLEKSHQYSQLAVYYYWGLYVKKNKKKGIQLNKKKYSYPITDKESEEDLNDENLFK
ncbi:hypothetical protein [Chryseobacterium luteum]|uniref:hypothetical protein n=1 Tax=Chryseobacterium luteum TaxID=421531 RepID=UPI00103E6247|nr:hypothetical protein [Chryseobacterium luteum]